MTKSTTLVWASILIGAFIAGVFFGVGLKYGLSPDPIDVSIFALQQMCTIEKTNEKVVQNCAILVPLGIVISIVFGLISIWVEANRIQSWKAGLGLYGAGWILGFLYFVYYIK